MNILGIETPYLAPIVYLAFQSRGYDHFINLMKGHAMPFEFMDDLAGRRAYKNIRESMPKELKAWHEKENQREDYPPHKEAFRWCYDRNIVNFYEQLFRQTPSKTYQPFVDAWSLFENNVYVRRIIEGLYLGQFSVEEIFAMTSLIQRACPVEVVECYFREIFNIQDMFIDDVGKWVIKIETYAKDNFLWVREARAKRYSLAHPLDKSGIFHEYNVGYLVSDEDMLRDIKQTSYFHFKRVTTSPTEILSSDIASEWGTLAMKGIEMSRELATGKTGDSTKQKQLRFEAASQRKMDGMVLRKEGKLSTRDDIKDAEIVPKTSQN